MSGTTSTIPSDFLNANRVAEGIAKAKKTAELKRAKKWPPIKGPYLA